MTGQIEEAEWYLMGQLQKDPYKLIKAYSLADRFEDSVELLDKRPHKNLLSINTLIWCIKEMAICIKLWSPWK